MHIFDIAVIGGGINGCGIAADAALRGLSTVLIEKDDLASQTSSASTKLIHGGLRYLEQYEFALVKKSLNERQTLLSIAPHLIRPIQFVIPHTNNARPSWLISAGLWIYDHLSQKNTLPRSHSVTRSKHQTVFSPLKNTLTRGHIYSDCATDDARLTLNNALLAKEHGAMILTNTELTASELHNNQWILTLKPTDQPAYTLSARIVVNATGPWIKQINTCLGIPNHNDAIALVKGSHLVVKKLYDGCHAYLLQHQDNRIVFVIPFHDNTLIGTTDVAIENPQDKVHITPEEITYLLNIVNQYFQKQIHENDIMTTWSGVRTLLAKTGKSGSIMQSHKIPPSVKSPTAPLCKGGAGSPLKRGELDKPQTLSRDYAIRFNQTPAPSLCIIGGKITTYRQLAKEAIDRLKPLFPKLAESRTDQTPLPGARFPDFDISQHYPWVPAKLLQRWMSTYGARLLDFLSSCTQIDDLGIHFGAGLYQREVDYLIKEEWARTCDDILWRRTKLGLIFSSRECEALEDYIKPF